MEASRARVIAHVDLDAFYTQVEVRRDPELKGKPVVVIQYNPFGDLTTLRPEDNRRMPDSNGSIIAVSYEARRFGVKRNMMAQEGKKLCPDLNIVQVPMAHGKADLTIYRNAGAQVVQILSRKSICERASIDEAYLDVTAEAHGLMQKMEGKPLELPEGWERVHVAGQDCGVISAESWWRRPESDWLLNERLLACGATIVASMRADVHRELGFTCSAGVAHYKSVAKLASGLHKPMQQTVVPAQAVVALLRPLPVSKLRQLGGKFGDEIMKGLGVQTVGELLEVPLSRLEALCGEEKAVWVQRLAHGIDGEEVKPRTLPKSMGCGKTFFKDMMLKDLEAVKYWLGELGKELEERLENERMLNERTPRLLTVQFDLKVGPQDRRGASVSRSGALQKPSADSISQLAFTMLKMAIGSSRKGWGITGMQLMAGNFAAAPTGASTITRFLRKSSSATASPFSAPSASQSADNSMASPGLSPSTASAIGVSPASTSTATAPQPRPAPRLSSRTAREQAYHQGRGPAAAAPQQLCSAISTYSTSVVNPSGRQETLRNEVGLAAGKPTEGGQQYPVQSNMSHLQPGQKAAAHDPSLTSMSPQRDVTKQPQQSLCNAHDDSPSATGRMGIASNRASDTQLGQVQTSYCRTQVIGDEPGPGIRSEQHGCHGPHAAKAGSSCQAHEQQQLHSDVAEGRERKDDAHNIGVVHRQPVPFYDGTRPPGRADIEDTPSGSRSASPFVHLHHQPGTADSHASSQLAASGLHVSPKTQTADIHTSPDKARIDIPTAPKVRKADTHTLPLLGAADVCFAPQLAWPDIHVSPKLCAAGIHASIQPRPANVCVSPPLASTGIHVSPQLRTASIHSSPVVEDAGISVSLQHLQQEQLRVSDVNHGCTAQQVITTAGGQNLFRHVDLSSAHPQQLPREQVHKPSGVGVPMRGSAHALHHHINAAAPAQPKPCITSVPMSIRQPLTVPPTAQPTADMSGSASTTMRQPAAGSSAAQPTADISGSMTTSPRQTCTASELHMGDSNEDKLDWDMAKAQDPTATRQTVVGSPNRPEAGSRQLPTSPRLAAHNATAVTGTRSWLRLDPSDVDATVLEELPEDIRKEVQQMLQGQQGGHINTSVEGSGGAPAKQAQSNKRRKLGSSKPAATGQRGITQYFKR